MLGKLPTSCRLPRAAGAFERWFRGSKVVDSKGCPLVVYHGTTAENFKQFEQTDDVGYHFGTLEAAEMRLKHEGEGRFPEDSRIIAAYLRIKRPLRMHDLYTWSSQNVVTELEDLKVLTPHESVRYFGEDWFVDNEGFTKALRAKGYDGVVYKNETEAGGDSWIALRPEQIKGLFAKRFDPKSGDFLAGVRRR